MSENAILKAKVKDLEAEIDRLRLELKQALDAFHSARK